MLYLPLKSMTGSFEVLKMNEDVLLLQTNGDGALRFHTFDNQYHTIQRVEDWAHYLRDTAFLRVDRGTIVNLNKVESFNPELKTLKIRTVNGLINVPVAGSMIKELIHRW